MSQIIGKAYNPYAMASGGSGLASGFAMGRQIAKEKELGNAVKGYVDAEARGDKEAMKGYLGLMAGVAPAETMNWINQQNALKQKDAITPYQQAMIDLKKQELEAQKSSGSYLNPYEKVKQQEQAKKEVETLQAQEDFNKMLPSVNEAIGRAKIALKSGTGLGKVGGSLSWLGWSTGKGQQNRADVESANTQMNQILRQKLSQMGLTGSELNSAVEANAYRYTISPFDDEDTSLRKIENFESDILGNGASIQQTNSTKEDPLGIR